MYIKNQEYQTPENKVIYYLFSHKWGTNIHGLQRGGTDTHYIKLSKSEFKTAFLVLTVQSQYLNAIHKASEIHGIKWEI